MVLSTIQLQLSESLEKNIASYGKFFEHNYKVFYELEPIIQEIGKFVILNLNYAVVTLTNHLLERLLKLSLIHKFAGTDLKPLDQLDKIFTVPTQKYGSLTLGNSIEQCKKQDILNAEEGDFLFNFVREVLRNGFSHGDARKGLSNMPDAKIYHNPKPGTAEWPELIFNPKVIPILQTIHMEECANENAIPYFDYVFQLMQRIETRLINMDK